MRNEQTMSYKTILVYLDDAAHVDDRVRLAANLAKTYGAHLLGTAMTGIPSGMAATWANGIGGDKVATYLGTVHRTAARTLHDFKFIAQEIGVATFEGQLVEDVAEDGLNRWVSYADLVIVSQYNPQDPVSSRVADLGEYVAMSNGVPVLVVPHAGQYKTIGDRVLIGWNGSAQAVRAVRSALPILQRAAKVEVAIFSSSGDAESDLIFTEGKIIEFLARHGVQASVIRRPRNEESNVDVGDLLLSMVADVDANLLVMGCYGHTRFKEILLGGTTRTILRSMTVPVLMAH
jgi:nucleotide-binding universal stress UspA family protein